MDNNLFRRAFAALAGAVRLLVPLLQERIHLSFPPKGGRLLKLSRAFSATLTGRFGMGMVRVGAEGMW
jgi:hypothetical protein